MVRASGVLGSVIKGFGLVILVVLDVFLFGNCEGKVYEDPPNCRHIECPPYKVIYSQRDYEIRSYEIATWMSTPPINSSSFRDAVGKGFSSLFAYIQGKNKQAAKIDMTAPVLVDIYPSTGPFCNSSFVVHFYVPKKYQRNPPLSSEVKPVKLPNHRYAAIRRFGGFMDDSTIASQGLALMKSLKGSPWEESSIPDKHNEERTQPYSVAGYNSPFELKNRVNEIIFWFDK